MHPRRFAHLEATAKPKKRMVYMVCDHLFEPVDYFYSIFALDISEGDQTISDESPKRLPEPIFRMGNTYPVAVGCFSLGNKIYLFGGFHSAQSPFAKRYGLSTSEYSLATYVVDPFEKTILKGPFLKAPKLRPLVVHLNQRVYVLSRSFGEVSPPPHFEVFDPDLQTWEGLLDPPLPANVKLRKPLDVQIRSHAVLGTTIYISMPVGIFSFDVENPDKGWTHLPVFNGVSEFPFTRNAELVNEHWVSWVFPRHLIVSYDPCEENGLTKGKGKTLCSISWRPPWDNQNLLFKLGNSELGMVSSWCNENTECGAFYVKGMRHFYEFSVFQMGMFMEFEERPKKIAKQDTHTSVPLCPSSYKVTFVTDDREMTMGTIVALFPMKM